MYFPQLSDAKLTKLREQAAKLNGHLFTPHTDTKRIGIVLNDADYKQASGRGLGKRGQVTDQLTGKRYEIEGAACSLPTCVCDAIARPVEPARKSRRVPPDPEKMNDERAEWAAAAIEAFEGQTRTDREDAVCDLLADLAHWCDRNDMNMGHELRRAIDHYDAETNSKGKQFEGVVTGN